MYAMSEIGSSFERAPSFYGECTELILNEN